MDDMNHPEADGLAQASALQRYHKHILFGLALVALLGIAGNVVRAFGFGPFPSPERQFVAVRADISSHATRLDAHEAQLEALQVKQQVIADSMAAMVTPLLVAQCLDRTPREIQLMRLNCRRILNP